MPPASFSPHLTMDPLPLAVCLLWSYRTRDFHPLDYTHAGRTPFCRLRRRLSTGKRLTRFSVAYDSLRIVFACHPGGGDLLYVFLRSYVAHCTVPIVPPHSGGKVVPQAPKGGKRPKAANYRNGVSADESKGIQPEPAGSRKPAADCLHLYPSGSFPPTGI